MKKPTVISTFTKKGQTDIVEIIRGIFVIIVLAWAGWIIAGVFELQEIVGAILVSAGILAVASIVAYLVYIVLGSLGIAAVVFLSLAGLLAAIVFGVPALVNIGIGVGITVIIILCVYFTY